jgi:hypothetical protein
MTSIQIMRRLGPWLLGLFLIAQIAGVAPLFSAHTHHIFESKQIVAADNDVVVADQRGAHHHHGLADLNDQCCAFHHLTGVLPYGLDADRIGFTGTAIVAAPTRALAAADPILIERPPKPQLSI